MERKHNFVDVAEIQKESGTLFGAGLDIHGFGGFEKSQAVYGFNKKIVYDIYFPVINFMGKKDYQEIEKLAGLLAGIENYIEHRVIDTLVNECDIRIFKLQFGLYVQFGAAGIVLLHRIKNYLKDLEVKLKKRIIVMLDCKCGDITTTQQGYFTGFIGSLKYDWGIDIQPFDFDIINVAPWVGEDAMLIHNDKGETTYGYHLITMYGKGIVGVNKTTNKSGPQYQELVIENKGRTVQMCNVMDIAELNRQFKLEYKGLSALGLVVGSTHQCNGSIRQAFPSTTLWVPGFGAQQGPFSFIMPELIRGGEWNGLGAIFCSSRAIMFAFESEYGGSGDVKNLEKDIITSISNFRKAERAAYIEAGITYPFDKD